MNYLDALKSIFYGGYIASNITLQTVAICMLVTIVISVYIFWIYRWMNRNAFYNRNFNVSLIATALIVAAIILTIQTNIVISLGMVGALSIVRFRTAIKDPLDLVFLFWSIGVGIICGAGFASIAVCVSICLTVVFIVVNRMPSVKTPMILVISAVNYELEREIIKSVSCCCSYYKVRSRNVRKERLEMALEVNVKDESRLIKELMGIEGIINTSLVSHEGEVTF